MLIFQLPPSPKPKRKTNSDNYINPSCGHVDRGFDQFYRSSQWRRFRELIAKERGTVCQDNEHEAGKSRVAGVELDHIVELADGGAPLDRANVMFRCRSCHVRKTNRVKAERSEREFWERRARS